MTTMLIDLVIVFWLVLFGGMALLPILTGGRGQAVHEAEDRVISIAPARSTPSSPMGARMPLVPEHDHHRHAA
jgi:hypothetical protein